ncbi:TolC family protein [Halarsenatibacter silvermanii]|uniref:Outer membrane protein TolC n=1 Tax=Halarsenatibacter silvermanii TaxID=321763 RepID=A0A1G9IDG2_9FIRM|nr:TolC family protein [Halarsenatibacter silvermanii]SDL22873.1 Outer membrane protein TolC [Halarsenatibacter silvermanii]
MNKLGMTAIIMTIVLSIGGILFFPRLTFAAKGNKLELETALARAEKSDDELEAARHQLEAAKQRKLSSETILNPKIEGEMGWQKSEKGESEGELAGTINYSNILAESRTISTQLDIAELSYEKARLNYRENRNEILQVVAEKYYSLLEIKEQIASQEQRITQLESLYQEAEEQYEDDMLTEAGLLEIEFELETAQQHLKKLEDRARTERKLLSRRVDIDPNQLELKSPENFSLIEEMNLKLKDLEDSSELIQKALNYRSDFQNQLLAARLAEKEAKYISSQKDPDLILSGEYNFNDGSRGQASLDSNYELSMQGHLTTEDVLEDPFEEKNDWEITAGISYEFSDGGRRKADIAEADAEEKEHEIRADYLAESIEIEIESLLYDISRHRTDVEIAATNLERAELEYNSALTRWQKEAITESELLAARSLLAEAEMEKINLEYELGRKKIELLGAMQKIYSDLISKN